MSQLATDILCYVTICFFWIPFISFTVLMVVYLFVSMIKTEKLKKEYYNTLSREDKDVIDSYKGIEWSIFTKHNKNEEKK